MKKIFKNKKFKILGLSTLSFGLLIPIIVTTAVACANTSLTNKPINPENNKQNLSAVQAINANELGLTGTAYANFDTIVNNSNNFAFNNLKKFLTGDISLITASDTGIRSAKIDSNKISISFDLVVAAQKFYVNNKLSEKEFSQTITINGFQALEAPQSNPNDIILLSQTNIKSLFETYGGALFNSGILNLGFFPNLETIAQNTLATDASTIFGAPLTQVIFNANIVSIGANAFSNNQIVSVTIEQSTKLTNIGKNVFANNPDLTSITVANDKIKMLFTQANFNGTINVTNPNPPSPGPNPPVNPSPETTDKQFALGGSIKDTRLITSAYNLVANTLGLSAQNVLSKLNFETINNNLHKKYPNLNVSLANGSNEYEGVLNLNLNGNYIGQSNNVVNIKDKLMTISGFYTFKSDYRLSINKASINMDAYFSNLQTREMMISWTSADWLDKYLATLDASFLFGGSRINVLEFAKNSFLKNFAFTLLFDDKNKPNLIIKASWQPKKYENNVWIEIINSLNNSNSFTINFDNASLIQIPNLVEAKEYYVSQTFVDNTVAAQYYASYVRNSLINNFFNNFTDILGLIKYKPGFSQTTFEKTYFGKEKLYYKVDLENGSIDVSDLTGVLDFSAALVSSQHEYDQKVIKRFLINNFKTINNLNGLLDANQKPLLQISKSYSFYNRLLKALKEKFPDKASLDQLANNESVQIPDSLIRPTIINVGKNLNLFISTFSQESNEEKFNKYFKVEGKPFASLNVFGGNFVNIFDPNSGNLSFSMDGSLQKLGVQAIDINLPDGSSWTLLKNHSSSFSIQIPIQLEVTFYGATRVYTGLMFASILMSDFGYENALS